MPAKKEDAAASGPFWVENKRGDQFWWASVPEGHKDTGESPFDSSGNPRKAVPAKPVNPSETEGIVL